MNDNPGLSLFQGRDINIENVLQNQEEEEDLEEQKRRQEEIQNLLTVAMDEFNYDDQSTANSSTNVSLDSNAYRNRSSIERKYQEACFEDQLKILYEVRVREVKSLSDELEKLKLELLQQKEFGTKTSILLEAEKDKAQISYKQSQALLVSKTEEIASLQQEVSNLQMKINHLEEIVKSLREENDNFKHSNNELMDQLNVMQSGLTTNTISDRQILENHQSEVAQLHHILDNTHSKLHRKEKECKEFQQQLRETMNEKDIMVAEKCGMINKLTISLEDAQRQCHELLQIIEKVSQENRSLKTSNGNELTDSIRIMGLADKTEIVKAMQRELEKSHDIQAKQQFELNTLQKTFYELSENYNTISSELEQQKKENTSLILKNDELQISLRNRDEEVLKLKSQLEDNKNVPADKEVLENETRNLKDTSVQVSRFFQSSNEIEIEENEKLNKELNVAHSDINLLKERLFEAEERVSKLTMTISLEKERDNLIRTLQEKAAQFEKIIKERQNEPELFSVGVNTDSFQENENLLQAKYEGEMVQKEIQLRVELKQVFDEKLEKIEQDLAMKMGQLKQETCSNCPELIHLLKQHKSMLNDQLKEMDLLKQHRKQDREAIATLLEDWSTKFLETETEKKEIVDKYEQIKSHCNEIALQLKTRDAGDAKLYDVIKRECEETIKMWNKHAMEVIMKDALAQRNRILQINKRIDEYSTNADREVSAIEMHYSNKKQSLKKLFRGKI